MSEANPLHFARGFKASPPHRKALLSAPHPSEAAASFPPAASLRSHKPVTFDQGPTPTCVGHAVAALLVVGIEAHGQPLPFIPSPRGIWSEGACLEQGGEGALVPEGIDAVSAVQAIARTGIRPIQAPTPDGRNSDCTSANVFYRPTLAEDELAAKDLVMGPQELQPAAHDFLDQICDAIANDRFGVLVGVHATPAFEAWKEGAPALTDASGFSQDDGHAVALLDYRTSAAGEREFWLLSSWGLWGEDGGIWVTGSWLVTACIEAWRWTMVFDPAAEVVPPEEAAVLPPTSTLSSEPVAKGEPMAEEALELAELPPVLDVAPPDPTAGEEAVACAHCGHILWHHAFRPHAEHDVHHCLECDCPAFEPPRSSDPDAITVEPPAVRLGTAIKSGIAGDHGDGCT